MIRQLTNDDFDAAVAVVNANTHLMGLEIDDTRRAGIARIIKNCMQGGEDKAYGLFDGDKLIAFRCVEFNIYINAMITHLVFSTGKTGRAHELLKHIFDVAREAGFNQGYAIVENAWRDKWLVLFNKSNTDWKYAVDEVVPTGHRPFGGFYWAALYHKHTKAVDTAVLHYWLPQEFRNATDH